MYQYLFVCFEHISSMSERQSSSCHAKPPDRVIKSIFSPSNDKMMNQLSFIGDVRPLLLLLLLFRWTLVAEAEAVDPFRSKEKGRGDEDPTRDSRSAVRYGAETPALLAGFFLTLFPLTLYSLSLDPMFESLSETESAGEGVPQSVASTAGNFNVGPLLLLLKFPLLLLELSFFFLFFTPCVTEVAPTVILVVTLFSCEVTCSIFPIIA